MSQLWENFVVDVNTTLAGAVEVSSNIVVNLRDRLFKPSNVPFAPSISGKTCLITGGTAGIGNAAAELIACAGAKAVIITGRNAANVQSVATRLQTAAAAAGTDCQVKGMQLDLASVKDVKRFCKALEAEGVDVDVAICNAGVMAPLDHQVTADGMELQFQTNHLGHFMLATDLAARHFKRQGGRSGWPKRELRIVIVTSMAHHAGKIRYDDLMGMRQYVPFRAYAQSKLANVMTAVELQRRFKRLSPPDATASAPLASAVAVHPGIVDTELARGYFIGDYLPAWFRPVGAPLLKLLFPYVLLTPAASARNLLWGAFAPADLVAGQYVWDCKVREKAAAADDEAACKRLWDTSCQLAGISDPL